ncbi:MAG: hypothetical protein WCA79_09640 [Anaerolineales bacterium]
MKHVHTILLAVILLAACQTSPATSVPISPPTIVATPQPAKVNKGINTPTPTLTPMPNGPVVHSSDTDPNASDLIVVKDQFIANNSLTLDSVTSAEASFIVLYYDVQRQGRDHPGKLIVFAPVSVGKTNQFIISLNQNLNSTVNPTSLPGNRVIAVLQANVSNPSSIVKVNGKDALVPFTILSQGPSSVFSTATP